MLKNKIVVAVVAVVVKYNLLSFKPQTEINPLFPILEIGDL